MEYPDEKVAEVCKLGPVAASDLLTRGRAGDLQALADWSVRAAYRKLLRHGLTPPDALRKTRDIMAGISLKVAITA